MTFFSLLGIGVILFLFLLWIGCYLPSLYKSWLAYPDQIIFARKASY